MSGRDRRVQEGYSPELVAELAADTDSERPERYNSTLSFDSLVPFANHPFKLYEGTRFNDMVESIKAKGVISPIIVRPIGDNKYEILAGHNRVNAAKEAGLQSIPAIVYKDLTDDEAKLIVTDSNFNQQSLLDMTHSERAAAFSMYYEAMKKTPGYRSDLLDENESPTCSKLGNRSRTIDKLGKQVGLSKNTIFRYVRISKLAVELQTRLDNKDISLGTAESLSYLRMGEQEIVEQMLGAGKKISLKQADALKKESANGELSQEVIERILVPTPAKPEPINLNKKKISQYFKPEQTAEEIESVIAEALEMYFNKKG